ncbi:MAG: Cof-type HAD-IIB family hydrolase [Bacillota bacterium]|nr:Cof-type HAD-IIB family hydrolase [Bacillota bacterium]
MMDCKLICLDIDGTLLNSKHKITELTRKVIHIVSKEKGIPITLISARMPKAMASIRNELEIKDPIACFGGAVIIEDDKYVINKVLDADIALKLYESAENTGVHMSLYKEDNWYVEKLDYWAKQESDITNLQPYIISFPNLFTIWRENKTGPNKILFMSSPEKIIELKKKIEISEKSLLNMYLSKETYLEVMPSGVGKKETVELICKMYNISKENVLAIGDNDNDIGMIEYAGIGIAMGNALDSVKQSADYVTKSNDEDGVSEAIEKFILN